GIAARLQAPAHGIELVHDRDDVAPRISPWVGEDADEPLHARLEAGLLADLADDRVDRRLAQFDEATREGGHPPIRFILPTDRHELPAMQAYPVHLDRS